MLEPVTRDEPAVECPWIAKVDYGLRSAVVAYRKRPFREFKWAQGRKHHIGAPRLRNLHSASGERCGPRRERGCTVARRALDAHVTQPRKKRRVVRVVDRVAITLTRQRASDDDDLTTQLRQVPRERRGALGAGTSIGRKVVSEEEDFHEKIRVACRAACAGDSRIGRSLRELRLCSSRRRQPIQKKPLIPTYPTMWLIL